MKIVFGDKSGLIACCRKNVYGDVISRLLVVSAMNFFKVIRVDASTIFPYQYTTVVLVDGRTAEQQTTHTNCHI